MALPDLQMTITYSLGFIMILMIPAITTLVFSVWQKQVKALDANTIAIVELRGHLEHISALALDVPKLRRDLDKMATILYQSKNRDKDKIASLD